MTTPPPRGRPRLVASALLCLGVIAAGELYLQAVVGPAEERAAVDRWGRELASHADLRRLALERWLQQGLHDARMVAAFPSTVELTELAADPRQRRDHAAGHLGKILDILVRHGGYERAWVLDRSGRVLAPPSGPAEGLTPSQLMAARGVIDRAAATVDVHAGPETAAAFAAPILSASGAQVLGAAVLVERAEQWLVPFLAGNAPADEARAVLVWRDGGRQMQMLPPAPAALEASPAGRSLRSAAAAALETPAQGGWFLGQHGRPVLAATRRLNDGRWGVVVEASQDTVLGPLRRRLWAVSLQLGAILGLLGLSVLALTFGLQRAHEARLARQRTALATLFDQANDAILVMSHDGRLIEANRRAEEVYGHTREELLRRSIFDLRPAALQAEALDRWRETLARGHLVYRAQHLRGDGALLAVEISSRLASWADQAAVVAIVRDVSERQRAEAQILRLNRLLRTLFEARAAVVRAEDRTALFDGVCNVLTAGGLAPLAWIGWLDEDGRLVRPVAGAGLALDYINDLFVRLDSPHGGGPTGRAVTTGRPAICQDVVTDPDMGPWRAAQMARGFRASAAFPLRLRERVVAVLSVYLKEPDAFGAEEVGLFESLAADLGVALTALERELARQQAETALKASELRYRLLAENTADVIWTMDLATRRFTYVSPSVRKLLGYEPEEVAEQPMASVLLPGDFESLSADLRANLAAFESGDESYRTRVREVDQLHKDGRLVPTEVVTTLMTNGDGRPVALLGVSRDISERRRAETALRERTTLLQAILESPAQSVFALDAGLRYTAFNRAHAEATRAVYGHVIALGESVLKAMTNESDRAAARASLERALAGEAVVAEAVWGDPARGQRAFEVAYNPIRGAAGTITGVAVFAVDVSERRRAESQLRQLWLAVEQSPVTVVITDPHGTIEYVNPKFTETTGYSCQEAIGANARILKSGHSTAEEYNDLWATITAGGVWQGEFLNRRKDGTRFWEAASIAPVKDAAGRITHFLAVKEDVTARKQAERDLRETQQQLMQAQKMEAIGRLAGGVAHDFNNLLGVIRGHSELLLRQLPADHPGRRRVEQILRSTDHAADLARQLLAFGRKQTLKVAVLQLGKVVTEAEKMLRRLIGEDVELRVVLPARLPPVKADPLQIEQVLLNLAVNARDAMPGGGSLTLELSRVDPATAVAEGLPEAAHVVLAVTDTGCGMSAETLSHLFEPFYTTKEVGKGTGLGLATVYGIVAQLGGQVRVESRVGQGSVFRVYLPAEVEETPVTAAVPTPGPATVGQGETVLLVEDEEGLRSLVAEQLGSLGYRVLVASRGDEALALARRQTGPIDLLVTDVVMPGGNGRDMARALKAERPDLRIVLMSGYSTDALGAVGGLDAGMLLLDKPFTLEALSTTLRAALAR